jgi:TonB family protein
MMKTIYFLTLVAALGLWSTKPAQAIAEFCPARLAMRPIDGGPPTGSRLFGFDLTAQGPRSVTAILAFDTNVGWYTAALPTVAIDEKDRHYTSPWADFVRRDFVSPKMYLQFPAAVNIKHVWVYTAQATGDDFGWAAKGQVTCAASADAAVLPNIAERPPILDPKDSDRLTDAPPPDAKRIVPVPSAPLGQTNCGQPFADATVTTPGTPDYPTVMSVRAPDGHAAGTSVIQVAINPNGTLSDAWVWGTSGFSALDNAALDAAKRSGYRGAIAYCQPVPGMYLFKVTFSPNS